MMLMQGSEQLLKRRVFFWFLRNAEAQLDPQLPCQQLCTWCKKHCSVLGGWVKSCPSKHAWVWASYWPWTSGPYSQNEYECGDTRFLSHNFETPEPLKTNFSVGLCHLTWTYVRLLRHFVPLHVNRGYFCISLQMVRMFSPGYYPRLTCIPI